MQIPLNSNDDFAFKSELNDQKHKLKDYDAEFAEKLKTVLKALKEERTKANEAAEEIKKFLILKYLAETKE